MIIKNQLTICKKKEFFSKLKNDYPGDDEKQRIRKIKGYSIVETED